MSAEHTTGERAASSRPSASAVFAEYLGRLESGADADFEALCGEHPELAAELGVLRKNWEQLDAVFARLGFSRSLSERLGERYGAEADPGISLEQPRREEPPPPGLGTEVLDRLQGRIPGFGRYRVQGELARGGQGLVLRVWDDDLKRTLAMKVALPRSGVEGALDPRSLGRFLEEAQVTSQLDHPGIVPVHELGLDALGRVYFTMKLVKGRDLRTIFELVVRGEEDWTTTRAVNVLLRVCEAMSYAHSKGVIHRDLKPANVMVGRFGEVHVMDWGLARILGREDKKDVRIRAESSGDLLSLRRSQREEDSDSPLVTEDGDVVGTPAYMPPEQATGRLDDIGPCSDVYSIGAMLYHLLAGRPPYVASSKPAGHYAILYLVQAGPPTPLRELAPRATPALAAICDKAIAREVSERYATMEELADDLRAYLEGRVVRAYETGPVAEFRRWIRRNRGLAAASAAALLIAIAGLASTGYVRTREARKALLQAYADHLALVVPTLELEDTAEARRNLEACPEEFRGWEWEHLALRCDQSLQVLRGHSAPVLAVAISSDGGRIASASEDGTVRVWDAASGRMLHTFPHGCRVQTLAFDTSDRVLSGADDGLLRIWEVASGALVWSSPEHRSPVLSIACDEGGLIVSGGQDGDILLWESGRARHLVDLDSNLDGVFSLVLAPRELDLPLSRPGTRGRRLFAGSRHGIALWDLESGDVRRIAHSGLSLDLSVAGMLANAIPSELGSPGRETRIELVDPQSGELVRQLSGHGGAVHDVCFFDPGGRRLASASADETVRLWDPETGEQLFVLRGHEGSVTCLAFEEGGEMLVSGSADGTIRLWDGGTRLPTDFQLGYFPIGALAFSPDGNRLSVVEASGDLFVLNAANGATLKAEPRFLELKTYLSGAYSRSPNVTITPIALRGDAAWSAVAELDGTVHLRRLGGVEQGSFSSGLEGPGAVAFSRDGRWLVTASRAGRISVQETRDGRLVSGWTSGEREVTALAFWPDARKLVSGTEDGSVQVWSTGQGELLETWKGHRGPVWSVAFDPQGRRAATCSQDGTLRIWDPERGRSLLVLRAGAPLTAVAFSPDGKRLVTGTEFGSIQFWETEVTTARGLWRAPRERAVTYEDLQPGARPALQRAAETLVDELFRQHLLVQDVVGALQEDASLDAELRVLALALAFARSDPTPSQLEEIAWVIVQDPYRSSAAYVRGLRAAERARELDPLRASALALAGAARFRLGEHRQAAAQLERALRDEIPPDRSDARPIALAFLALSQAELGRLEVARAALEQARQAASAAAPEVRQLVREAADRCR